METCVWLKFRYGFRTECDRQINRKPKNFKFCPYCGKLIVTDNTMRGAGW